MVVVENRRYAVPVPDERESVADAVREAWQRRDSPHHDFENVAVFIDRLLSNERRRTRHRIYGGRRRTSKGETPLFIRVLTTSPQCPSEVQRPVTISGALGDDAKHYQIRAVERAIEESKG
jgi:hypothetical protein